MELLLALAIITIVVVRTVRAVRSDGFGHAPTERSHADWAAGSLPSTAYVDLARFR
ncbi:hypothetical protein LVY72_18950 [Arthrobacter sp. I2-34]|uniref:Uncharacterized protein n=1 Tax=Arthrobacter hankyongi TaxID=2904801 RepID=A0ABS9LBD7_9MICC|nr:hypothetical protein [Arthrobacter hankyongi]MCG2623975.1 hypothetical protein [Arthrobacter hankyongi]